MSIFKLRGQRFFSYLRHFGIWNGVRAHFLVTRLQKRMAKGADIAIPYGLGKRLFLRAQTTDIKIFEQIFLNCDCAVPFRINPKLIVDCGAHIGCSAIYFALEYPNAKIIAVEAEPNNFVRLKQNTGTFPQITCIHAAIWSHSGVVRLKDPESEEWAFSVTAALDEGEPSIDSPATTIEELMKDADGSRIGLLKMDIEGAELEVFSHNCDSWLDKTDTLIIELHDRYLPGCTAAFTKALGRHPQLRERSRAGANVHYSR